MAQASLATMKLKLITQNFIRIIFLLQAEKGVCLWINQTHFSTAEMQMIGVTNKYPYFSMPHPKFDWLRLSLQELKSQQIKSEKY